MTSRCTEMFPASTTSATTRGCSRRSPLASPSSYPPRSSARSMPCTGTKSGCGGGRPYSVSAMPSWTRQRERRPYMTARSRSSYLKCCWRIYAQPRRSRSGETAESSFSPGNIHRYVYHYYLYDPICYQWYCILHPSVLLYRPVN